MKLPPQPHDAGVASAGIACAREFGGPEGRHPWVQGTLPVGIYIREYSLGPSKQQRFLRGSESRAGGAADVEQGRVGLVDGEHRRAGPGACTRIAQGRPRLRASVTWLS